MPKRNLVFVVDDDLAMRTGIARLLRVYGYEPEVFESVEEFESHANPEDAICLILDIHLSGRSGIEFGNQLSLLGVSVPLVFITANENDNVRKAAADLGCVAYLPKPFSSSALKDALENASARSRRNT